MGKWKSKFKSCGLRGMVIRIHGTNCAVCGEPCLYGKAHRESPDYLTIDHANPRALGGDDHLSNLRPTHRRCNELLGRLTEQELASRHYDWTT